MRKIKLMALLLAALMIVTAFAGCASVKQEDVDALDERVSAIEDLLKGQQTILDGLNGKIDSIPDNSDVLDAIDSMGKELNDKIDNLDSRVDEVEKNPATGTETSEAVKAKQAEALASIEVQKATFAKNADEYDEATYAAVQAAFGTAAAAVNAATTEAAVTAAMATLKTTLDSYKTYAMKLYDYYVALLGNVNEDAEELVDEALDFIDVVDEVYEDLDDDEKIEELQYLVSKGVTASKNVYLDVYTSVVNLCNIFAKTSGTYEVEYVNAKGKVVSGEFMTVNGFEKAAKALVKEIESTLGDEITYDKVEELQAEVSDDDDRTVLEALQDKYEGYVEAAELIGGDKLVDLVTNADVLVDAEDAIESLLSAYDAFETLNGRGKDGLYYYDELDVKVSLTFVDDDDTVWTEEYYAEEIEAVLEDWMDEYDLSDDNATSIIEAYGYDYDEYLSDRRTVALVAAAYETFLDEIVPAVEDLNKLTAGSSDAVQDYKDLKDAVEALYLLQEGDAKADNALDKKNITLSKSVFQEFIEESGILNISELNIKEMSDLDDDEAAEIDANRIKAFMDGFTSVESIGDAFVDLFTFNADVKAIARAEYSYAENFNNTDDILVPEEEDNAGEVLLAAPEIYNFFAVEYTKAENEAEKINNVIEKLVELVEDKKISSNLDFITLAGEYINVENDAIVDLEFVTADKNFKVDEAGQIYLYTEVEPEEEGEESTWEWVAVASDKLYDVYVAVEDALDYDELTTDVRVNVQGVNNVLTIDYYNYAYPVFEDLIDIDDFEAAKKQLETRIVELFADIDELETLIEKIDYVRPGAYEFEDKNNNGKYDEGEESATLIDTYSVSLNDKAAVDAAVAVYDAWVYNGGNEKIAIFTEIMNDETEKVYGGVYNMKGFENADEVVTTLNTLRKLENKIETLVKKANAFVNGVKLINDVNSLDSISYAKLDNNTGDRNRYAITKYSPISGDSQAVANRHGSYTYINKDLNSDGYLYTSSETYTTNMTSTTTAHAFLGTKAMTKAQALMYVVAFYNAFVDANIEYTAASNNDYENGSTVYYVNNGYAAYKSVDDAKATYDKYDLIAAQAACLNAVGNSGKEEDETFKRQLKNADTLAKLDNVIGNYNSVAGTVKITEDTFTDDSLEINEELASWTIYDFANLYVGE